jgi:hypothetical protein
MESKKLLTLEQAHEEIESWLDYKKISAQKRKSFEDQIETLQEAICEGSLVLEKGGEGESDSFKFVQALKFPFGKEEIIKELTYRSRIGVATIHLHLKDVKSTDADGRLLAHIAALTSQNKELLKKMDTVDYTTASAIAMFFI